MLKILSPLEMVERTDVLVSDTVLASGYTGSWVQPVTNNVGYYFPNAGTNRTADFPTSTYKRAYIVWSEGNKRGATLGSTPTAGYSPDTANTKKVTTLMGKWRGLTDQIVAGTSTTPGTLLTVVSGMGANAGRLTELPLHIPQLSGVVAGSTSIGVPFYSGIAVAWVRNYYTWFIDAGVRYSGVWEIESL